MGGEVGMRATRRVVPRSVICRNSVPSCVPLRAWSWDRGCPLRGRRSRWLRPLGFLLVARVGVGHARVGGDVRGHFRGGVISSGEGPAAALWSPTAVATSASVASTVVSVMPWTDEVSASCTATLAGLRRWSRRPRGDQRLRRARRGRPAWPAARGALRRWRCHPRDRPRVRDDVVDPAEPPVLWRWSGCSSRCR